MFLEFAISIGIGVLGAVFISGFWIYVHIVMLRNRILRVLEIIFHNMKKGGNERILPWYCTREFMAGDMATIMAKIREMGAVIIVDKLKIQLMKHSDYRLHVIIAFEIQHQNGLSRVQAIMHRKPASVQVQQMAIF